jgi:thiol-disulfide isomerase/thioredoxin
MRMVTRIFVFVALLGLAVAPGTVAQDATPPVGEGLPACANGSRANAAEGEDDPKLPEWQSLAMTNARTGEEFAIRDFLGCAVYVETMATWCVNCLMQMGHVAEALPSLDPDRHVVIAISVETDLPAEDLARYADNSNLDWIFSVASPEVLKAIVDEFGRDAIVPPSTPHVIVNPDGTASDLLTGLKGPDEIVELMNEASGT